MARASKKVHRLTEAEILKLGRKALHRLTPADTAILKEYWDARLKAMKWPVHRAEDTHRLTYMPQRDLERRSTDALEADSTGLLYAWYPPSGSVRADILEVFREAVRPYEPCGGGRRVGPERFRYASIIKSDI